MPKFTFKDTEQRTFETVPEGDYKLEIVGFESCLSTGGKTRGCQQLVLDVGLVDKPSVTFKTWVTLPDESTEPKLSKDLQGMADAIIKALNYNAGVTKGQEVDLSAETMLGLRGWARVIVDIYAKAVLQDDKQVIENGKPKFEERKSNKIHYWITNKEKLARNMPTPPAPEPATETSDPGW